MLATIKHTKILRTTGEEHGGVYRAERVQIFKGWMDVTHLQNAYFDV